MSYLCYFCFVCVLGCPTHIVVCFCFVYLRFVYPMFPVSLDYSFLIASSVFSNVYLFRFDLLLIILLVADYPFGI